VIRTLSTAAAIAARCHGTAPGFVALYQVNVTVPKGLSAGNQPLVLTISGVSSAPVQLPVK
jgi:uncharacterized protein (TIGR03437 family)